MSVKDLIVLGTSSQQPTRYRNHGAYLFRWNNEGFLFDPGEGTQRQFIFADIAPPTVTRIFISHFHGDHCLGLGSMLMRLNLDKVPHPIHCYYPASGKKYFDRLRYGTIYHEMIQVIEHPVEKPGVVHDDGNFRIEAQFLEHGVENVGWRITEPDSIRFDKSKLKEKGIVGPMVKQLERDGKIIIGNETIHLTDVSTPKKGESIAIVIDTRVCDEALILAHGAKLLLSESTYLHTEAEMARKHHHLTARQAAELARDAGVDTLVLTHFSARYLNVMDFEKEAQEVFPHSFAAHDLQRFSFASKRTS